MAIDPAVGGVKVPKVKLGGRQIRYLAQSVILEEAGSSSLVRMAMMTVSAVICAFIIWAAIAEVEEVAATTGEVIPTGRVQKIQHLEGGIVNAIYVKDGVTVEKGDILVRLDPSQARAELEQTRARLASLTLEAERHRAFGKAEQPNFDIVDPEFSAMIDDQRAIFQSQVEALENRGAVLQKQIEQRQTELTLFDQRSQTLQKNLNLLQEELSVRRKLFNKGLSSKLLYLSIQREVNDAKGEVDTMDSEAIRTRESLEEAVNRLAELESNSREEALSKMGDVTSELAQVRESLRRLNDRVERLEIKAPVTGIVKGLKTHTLGGVLPPGGELMEIVPVDDKMIVEAQISTRDIGHVRTGQTVNVKVVTYDYARYGGITGLLTDISASTFVDEQGMPYYRGIVELDQNYVGHQEGVNQVLPGMPVQADVNTGTKTLLQYLLKPIYTSLSQGFRER